jgi:hypothetical protein
MAALLSLLPTAFVWQPLTSVNIRRRSNVSLHALSLNRRRAWSSPCTVWIHLTAEFFDELATLLDRLATFGDPLLLAGDVNIYLERLTDPYTVQFNDLLSSYGLIQRVHGITHEDGGTLDVVCTRDDLPAPTIDVIDVGISDHCLVYQTSQLCRPQPVYESTARRNWRSFDPDVFNNDMMASALCNESQYTELDGDALASLYDSAIIELLDRQVRQAAYHRRSSSVLFDDECRGA